ncbi:MAG: acyl--CoA ligase [Planctomycetaceae bacterium]|nr:acyl--CoA ligase [Planctomycetaceae bacterium]
MRLEEHLETMASRSPNRAALIADEGRLTYRELDDAAARHAALFAACGVISGDRVVLCVDNSLEAVSALYGVLKAGAAFCLVNPATKAGKLARIAERLRAKVLVIHQRLLPAANELQDVPGLVAMYVAGPNPNASAPRLSDAVAQQGEAKCDRGGIDLDLAYVSFTSGSTGEPKGVMMTHQNANAAVSSINTYLRSSEDDVVLSALPLSFSYGLYQVLCSVMCGGTVILERDFAYPQKFLQRLSSDCVTGFPVVPTMVSLILGLKNLADVSAPQLRYITNAAAALSPAHGKRLRELFPKADLFAMYGMTECVRGTYLNPAEYDQHPLSVGQAIPNTEAWIVSENGEPVAPGEVGELVIRGANVMAGYWEDPVATEAVVRRGRHSWERVLWTGDLFRRDPEGRLYHVARKDDLIKTRGEKVSPKEVEDILYQMPQIAEAAVIGSPDPVFGSIVKAFIVPVEESELTVRQVQQHCAAQLEDYMVPRAVEFRMSLPKTASGKIRKAELRKEAEAVKKVI